MEKSDGDLSPLVNAMHISVSVFINDENLRLPTQMLPLSREAWQLQINPRRSLYDIAHEV